MWMYFALWILCLGINAFPVKTKKGYNQILLICFSLLFLFGAFRYDFGNDYIMYENGYTMIHSRAVVNRHILDHFEIGYQLLNQVLPTFRMVLILTTLLTCFSYYWFFRNFINAKYRFLAFFILFLSGDFTIFFMLSGIRNAVAVSLLLLSTGFIIKRKIFPVAILCLIAATFHTSAILIFPIVYFVCRTKSFNQRNCMIWFAISILVALVPFEKFINILSPFIMSIFDRYSTYIDGAMTFGDTRSLLVVGSNLVMIGSFLWCFNKVKLKEWQTKIVSIALLYCIVSMLGSLNLRLTQYLCLFMIAGVILFFQKCQDKNVKYTILGLFILYRTYAFFVVFMNGKYFAYDEIHNLLIN